MNKQVYNNKLFSELVPHHGGKTADIDTCIHRESKNGATLTMVITLSVLDRFAKFFHCCKEH